jgi:hypothetical protein
VTNLFGTPEPSTCESAQFDEGFFYCQLPPGHDGPHRHQTVLEWDTEEEDVRGDA